MLTPIFFSFWYKFITVLWRSDGEPAAPAQCWLTPLGFSLAYHEECKKLPSHECCQSVKRLMEIL
jgi:hypothetical protein